MNDKQSNQIIGFAVVAIVAYYVLQMIVPFLIWGVIGLVDRLRAFVAQTPLSADAQF